MDALTMIEIGLRRIPWQLWAALALVLLAWAIHHHGYRAGLEKGRAELGAYRTQITKLTEKVRADTELMEAEQREAIAFAVETQRQGDLYALQNRDRVIAGLRSGTVRLREHFTCPAVAGVPQTPAGAGASDGTEAGGLSREDAEFLVREAGRADDVVRQLTACQAILKSER